jgi:oxaloacetate decarboxylase (Na+ extruding) subunit alpha
VDDVYLVNTTFRDGSQSLLAIAMQRGMIEPIAADMEAAGLGAIEVSVNPTVFNKMSTISKKIRAKC